MYPVSRAPHFYKQHWSTKSWVVPQYLVYQTYWQNLLAAFSRDLQDTKAPTFFQKSTICFEAHRTGPQYRRLQKRRPTGYDRITSLLCCRPMGLKRQGSLAPTELPAPLLETHFGKHRSSLNPGPQLESQVAQNN